MPVNTTASKVNAAAPGRIETEVHFKEICIAVFFLMGSVAVVMLVVIVLNLVDILMNYGLPALSV